MRGDILHSQLVTSSAERLLHPLSPYFYLPHLQQLLVSILSKVCKGLTACVAFPPLMRMPGSLPHTSWASKASSSRHLSLLTWDTQASHSVFTPTLTPGSCWGGGNKHPRVALEDNTQHTVSLIWIEDLHSHPLNSAWWNLQKNFFSLNFISQYDMNPIRKNF